MSTFWKNLQQLAHGQLFNGGYLGTEVVAEKAAKMASKANTQRTCSRDLVRRPPHPQIAAYR